MAKEKVGQKSRIWQIAIVLVSLAGIVALACREGQEVVVETPTEVATLMPLLMLPNAVAFQEVPTYDGSGQVVHPDIAYLPDGWNGYKYWMVVTPNYYDSDGRENPSIVVSNDGSSWEVPSGVTNPLIPFPPCDHNSDPDIVYNPRTDELYIYYMEQRRADYCAGINENRLRLMWSSDGVHWSEPQTVVSWDLGRNPLYLSPAIIYRDGSFEMWMTSETDAVVRATSEDGVDWSALQPVSADGTQWHLDVAYVEKKSEYWMLFVDSPLAGSRLKLATSKDGVNWRVYPDPVLVPGPGWDNERIYRATSLYDGGLLRVWYSAKNTAGQWHVGYSEVGVP